MWHDDEGPEIGSDYRSVISAWVIAASLLFGLAAYSAVEVTLSSRSKTLAGMNAPLSSDEFRLNYQDVLREYPVAVSGEPLQVVTYEPAHQAETVTPIE